MRVTRFVPNPEDTKQLGLDDIDMSRLGRVVVLSGPNGAGKTRVLRVLKNSMEALNNRQHESDEAIAGQLATHRHRADRATDLDPQLKQYRAAVDSMVRLQNLRRSMVFEPDMGGRRAQIAEFSTKDIETGHAQIQLGQVERQIDSISKSMGTDDVRAKGSSLLYINHVAERYFNATHPKTAAPKEEKDQAIASWEELERMVTTLLAGAKVERGIDGKVKINGRSNLDVELSDGQKALLVVAVALHAQSAKLDEAILLIDEPELYLHPDAQIEYISRLIQATPNGQVWIATHSVHILSHVDPDALWFVEGNGVRWAGTKPELVLSRLVGDEERIGKLSRFLQLPAIHAMQQFAAECLLAPAIVSTGAEDRQSQQIRKIIENIAAAPLRVLDYGAGRGRILAALRESSDLQQRLDYRAYEEIDAEARRACTLAIGDVYSVDGEEAERRVYSSESSLRERLNPGSVDVVVMCNALHEIAPTDWTRIFTGILKHCLQPRGYLLIVEDMHIPHGEHAHRHGFILLDTEQLQTLFGADREDPRQFRSFTAGERLKAHLVRADLLANVGFNTVKAALEGRRDSAMNEIRDLRKDRLPSFTKGRLLGLYAMLHANASLALAEMQ